MVEQLIGEGLVALFALLVVADLRPKQRRSRVQPSPCDGGKHAKGKVL